MSFVQTQKFVRGVIKQTGPRPWRRWYPMLSKVGADHLDEASEVLTCPDKISESLHQINVKMEKQIDNNSIQYKSEGRSDGLAFDKPSVDFIRVLDEVLLELESKTGFPGPARVLEDTLTADDFMDFIRTGAPFIDIGVSIFHGSQTHRIQRQMLFDHLGTKRASEVMETIATPGLVRPHPRDPSRHLTPWSDLLDSPVPFNYKNPQARRVKDIFSTQWVPVETNENYFPVLDARSAEWLQCVFVSAPAECFGHLTNAVAQEINEKARLDEVHHNIFATGLEAYHPDVRRAYESFGFVLPPAVSSQPTAETGASAAAQQQVQQAA